MPKDILYEKEAREKVFKGVEKLARAVSVTMGPKGRNVIVGKDIGAPTITKDGVSVAREVVLSDPFEELGCQLAKEVAGRTADVAGDGTTTATVLAHEIFSQGLDAMNNGESALDFRKGVEMALDKMLLSLDDVAKPIESFEDLRDIATISANNDEELGSVIAEAYHAVGDAGLVTANAYPGIETSMRVLDGIELATGYSNRSFLDSGESDWSVENCYILICNREVTHLADAGELLQAIFKKNRGLLIISKGLKKEAAMVIHENNARGRMKACGVKLPHFRGSSNPQMWLEDLAMIVGTKVVDEEAGVSLSELTINDLGFARQVTVDQATTKIVASRRDEKAIEARTLKYKEDLGKLLGDLDRRDTQNRLNFLSSRAAVITVGYSTELELREKGDRVEDAMCAVRAAREEGYVPGGGTALLKLANSIDAELFEERYRSGAKALLSSCSKPFKQILINAGINYEDIISEVLKSEDFGFGYNVHSEEFGSLTEMGVIDPKKVTRSALQNAATIAILLITTEAVIAEAPRDSSGWQPPAGYRLPEDGKLNHKY